MSRIFISYKRVDKDKVFKIKNQIEAALGEKCWVDLDGIESDTVFADKIIGAINQCEVFLFMYSKVHGTIKDYEKDWTIRELNFAQSKSKRIVFVNIDGSPLTDWYCLIFGTKHQVDGQSNYALNHLCKDLQRWLNNDVNGESKSGEQIDKSKSHLGEIQHSFSKEVIYVIIGAIILSVGIMCIFAIDWNKISNQQMKSISSAGENAINDQRDVCYIINTFIDASKETACPWSVFSKNEALIPKTSNVEHPEDGDSFYGNFATKMEYYTKVYFHGNPFSVDVLDNPCLGHFILYGANAGVDVLNFYHDCGIVDTDKTIDILREVGFKMVSSKGPSTDESSLWSKDDYIFALLVLSSGSTGTYCDIYISKEKDFILEEYNNCME